MDDDFGEKFGAFYVHFSMFEVHNRKSIIFATLYSMMK